MLCVLLLLFLVQEVPPLNAAHQAFTLTWQGDQAKEVRGRHFIAGINFFTKAAYDGMTGSAPNRKVFGDFLKDMGIQVLRWPAGTSTHVYLPNDFENVDVVVDDYIRTLRSAGYGSGLWPGYYKGGEHNSFYVKMGAYLAFCEEQDLGIYYQPNPCFYYDETEGEVRAITLNRYVLRQDANGDVQINQDYYKGERITEAAQALDTLLGAWKASGYSIFYFELGNEDYGKFDLNFDGIFDSGEVDTFARIIGAYIPIIRQHYPNALISVDISHWDSWGSVLLTKLHELGVLDDIDYGGRHYGFAAWPYNSLESSDDAQLFIDTDYKLAQSASSNQDLVDALLVSLGYSSGSLKVGQSETTTWRLPNWNSVKLNATLSGGLQFAHNAGQAIFESKWQLFSYWDAVSPYFGLGVYDSWRDIRSYHQINPTRDVSSREEFRSPLYSYVSEIPEEDKLPYECFIFSKGYINWAYSQCVTGKTYAFSVSPGSEDRDLIVFAAGADAWGGVIWLYVINTSGQNKYININLAGASVDAEDLYTGIHIFPQADSTIEATIAKEPGYCDASEYVLASPASISIRSGTNICEEFAVKPYSFRYVKIKGVSFQP